MHTSRTFLIRKGIFPIVLLAGACLGASALRAQGFEDLYLGTNAGNPSVSTGDRNTAIGEQALSSNTSASDNTALGAEALAATTNGNSNTAVGSFALVNNTTGQVNTAVGSGALPANTSGTSNSGFGVNSLNANTTGTGNTALGYQSLFGNTTASNSTAVGSNALTNSTGANNIALGHNAGYFITAGTNNIEIGNLAPGNESSTIRIGATQTRAFLAGVNGVTVSSGTAVYIDSNGQLGTVTSSKRFKEDIEDMGDVSGDLKKLRPVTFHYKAPYDDGTHLLQYGLIAEEVAKVLPDLVQYDQQGKPFTVRYNAVNAMLLAGYQKQQEQIERQKDQLQEQEARIKRLEALVERMAGAN